MVEHPLKKHPTIGCCGLDCGLCPRFYVDGSSRCPGCSGPDFFNKNPGCGFITCCRKKRKLEVCGQCQEFPCSKFARLGKDVYDSFITHRKAMPNLRFIKERGLEEFIGQQNNRITLLHKMLDEFNEGRSKSYYCLSATLLSIRGIVGAIETSKKMVMQLGIQDNVKAKAKVLRKNLQKVAEEEKIELKLIKPPTWK